MNELATKMLVAGTMTAIWFIPYYTLIRARLHRAVDGGITGVMLVATVYASSALAVSLGWAPSKPESVLSFAVLAGAVVLVAAALAGALTYSGLAVKRSANQS